MDDAIGELDFHWLACGHCKKVDSCSIKPESINLAMIRLNMRIYKHESGKWMLSCSDYQEDFDGKI